MFAASTLSLCYNGYIMKIATCSDLHLEFGPLTLANEGGADVLILSGDILVERDLDEFNEAQVESGFARHRSVMYHTFFQECAQAFPHVIYVAGNHEHYHGDFKYTLAELKRKFAYLPNVYVLDREVKVIDDVTFIGGTLWTDMNKEDPLTLYHMKGMMNDFRCVKNSNRDVTFKAFEVTEDGRQIPTFKTRPSTFCAEDAVEDHKKMLGYIQVVTDFLGENPNKYVVVGHHAPSRRSTHPRYAHDTIMNGGYSSELDEFILSRPCIKLWTHGHTHEDFDYMIGETRIVCNPRGYIGHEERASKFELKYVEV
jgi:predicted phosphodiesterase